MKLHSHPLNLSFGLNFIDLYQAEGLERLDRIFLQQLQHANPEWHQRLMQMRALDTAVDPLAESEFILQLAPFVDHFITDLFQIHFAVEKLRAKQKQWEPLYQVKRQFIQRTVVPQYSSEQVQAIDGVELEKKLRDLLSLNQETGDWLIFELHLAQAIIHWQQHEKEDVFSADALNLAALFAAWACFTEKGKQRTQAGVLFKNPKKYQADSPILNLQSTPVQASQKRKGEVQRYALPIHFHRHSARASFALTDQGAHLAQALDQIHYCIKCHRRNKDSCRKGFLAKAKLDSSPQLEQSPLFKQSAVGITLTGCPLSEKISEFHSVKEAGDALAALAVIMIDNPLVAATGHRICIDCMQACIYQKQTPVNIPQIETRTLKDVLALPWGFEIYSLLTRWNPLNFAQPYAQPYSGYRVLIVGMGPAGYTLAHYLLNQGHTVVGIEGLKVEPLAAILNGIDQKGQRVPFAPIEDYHVLLNALEERTAAGFGGVSEYGITVRWDKNFLTLIRILLERRTYFSLIGQTRFSGKDAPGTLTAEQAFALGFDHIALALGAGRPTLLDIPNGLARGVRCASDFLMNLQQASAFKMSSLTSVHVRLPIIVVGGGLTAIDAATEALAYYLLQIEKFSSRYQELRTQYTEDQIFSTWNEEECEIVQEYLMHAQLIQKERLRAEEANETAHITQLLQQWGGATIIYRKAFKDAPAVRSNFEEVEKALTEGITFIDQLEPIRFDLDKFGAVCEVQCRQCAADKHAQEIISLKARTVLIAAGTQPNTLLAREDVQTYRLDQQKRYFQAIDLNAQPVNPAEAQVKAQDIPILLVRIEGQRFISFLGDLHPSYFGNVVKAIASAKRAAPLIAGYLTQRTPTLAHADAADFLCVLRQKLTATVYAIQRLTPNIIEILVHAPFAAQACQPGQFFRLQNFEATAQKIITSGIRHRIEKSADDDCKIRMTKSTDSGVTVLAMEGVALTAAQVDKEQGLITLIALELGASSSLCQYLSVGMPVALMGPTGAPTVIPCNKIVALIGGGLGNAVLFSIGAACKQQGSRIVYFAAYKTEHDRYHTAAIEAAADCVVWCCDQAPGFTVNPMRPQDLSFVGNVVDALHIYAQGKLGKPNKNQIAFSEIDHFIVIGSDKMMAAVQAAQRSFLAPYLKLGYQAIASINSPMLCMMKEICAQCLQRQVDEKTGRARYVFSCSQQDQVLDKVDFTHLNTRLQQNTVQEKLTIQWLDYCLGKRFDKEKSDLDV